MSPSKFQESEVTKGVMINGTRPSPLKINKDSHGIHKPSSSSHHQQVIDNSNRVSTKRQPVIIYTHSPKVIHAQASDFMALVQKLTGLSRLDDVKSKSESTKDEGSEEKDYGVKNARYEENESSSVLTDEKCVGAGEVKQDSSAISPLYKVSNSYLLDAPLFTPNSNEFFCSSRSNPLFQSPNSILPSFMDFRKEFPEY